MEISVSLGESRQVSVSQVFLHRASCFSHFRWFSEGQSKIWQNQLNLANFVQAYANLRNVVVVLIRFSVFFAEPMCLKCF